MGPSLVKYADAPCPPNICRDYALLIEYVLLQNLDLDELIEGQKTQNCLLHTNLGNQLIMCFRSS